MVTSQEQQSCGFYDQSQGSSSIPFVGSYQYFSSYVVYYIYIYILYDILIYIVYIYIYICVYVFPLKHFGFMKPIRQTPLPFGPRHPGHQSPSSRSHEATASHKSCPLGRVIYRMWLLAAIIDPSISISLNVLAVIQVCKKKQKKKEVKQSNTWSTSPFLPFWGNVSTRPRSPAPPRAPMAATPWQLRGQLLLSPGAEKSGPKGCTNLVFPCLSSKT